MSEVTRRDFVKGAAAGAVVVASAGILASCTSGSAVETGIPESGIERQMYSLSDLGQLVLLRP